MIWIQVRRDRDDREACETFWASLSQITLKLGSSDELSTVHLPERTGELSVSESARQSTVYGHLTPPLILHDVLHATHVE